MCGDVEPEFRQHRLQLLQLALRAVLALKAQRALKLVDGGVEGAALMICRAVVQQSAMQLALESITKTA